MPSPDCSRFPRLCERLGTSGGSGGGLMSTGPAERMMLIVMAMMVVGAVLATTLWWLVRHRRSRSTAVIIAGRSVAAGALGGISMVPVGLVLNATGFQVNKYGELLLEKVLGQFLYSAMAIEHFAISIAMAVPLVALLTLRRQRHPILLGLGYGAAIWFVVNSLALPIAFGQSTPWQLGVNALWPSLLVHVVYGLVVAAVATRDIRRYAQPEPAFPAPAAAHPGARPA